MLNAKKTSALLKRKSEFRPTLAFILGSGFSGLLEAVHIAAAVPSPSIPGFPSPKVPGHPGGIYFASVNEVPVLILAGRVHYYEGYDMEAVTFPIRVLAEFGIKSLVLTNAAGAINPRFQAGDFMMIKDHINGMGANPLRGPKAGTGECFIDLTEVYDVKLRGLLRQAARKRAIPLKEGVYLAVSGPSYETPAEIRCYANSGADAVGMSTVPEAIVGRQCGLRILGLSFLSNKAAHAGSEPLSHQEVLERGRQSRAAAAGLLKSFVMLYGKVRD